MPDAILGEIRLLSFPFSPRGWVSCSGALMSISQNQALFSILGTTYGGNGSTTFALPELRGRVPLHPGGGIAPGQQGGAENHTLDLSQMPSHTHQALGTSVEANQRVAEVNTWASSNTNPYGLHPDGHMNTQALGISGAGQPHANMQPYNVVNYCLAVQGIYPSREGATYVDQYIGEIRLFAGNYAPGGWSFCNGQLLPIAQNQALFAILGTMYGGDGRTTFALPNLSGRAPMHQGNGPGLQPRPIGGSGGSTSVTLTTNELPAHNHMAACHASSDKDDPTGGIWSSTPPRGGAIVYATDEPSTPMNVQALGVTGGNQGHNNMQPYLGLNFIIALQGIFPPRS